jgi:hypothetical protein
MLGILYLSNLPDSPNVIRISSIFSMGTILSGFSLSEVFCSVLSLEEADKKWQAS